jgi:hypothetical protein
MSRGFPNRKNKTYATGKESFDFTRCENRSTVVGQPSTSQEQDSEKKMCRLMFVELGQRLGRMRNTSKYVKRNR